MALHSIPQMKCIFLYYINYSKKDIISENHYNTSAIPS